MRSNIIFIMGAVSYCPVVLAADFEVPTSGTLAQAVAAANNNTNNKPYEITVAGDSADSANIKKSTTISSDSTTRLSGSLTFSGTGIKSTLSNLSFVSGQGPAVTSGTLGFGEAQDLTIDSVSFNQRTGGYYGGAVSNLGNMTINNSSFSANQGNLGGAIYSTSKNLDVNNSSFSGNKASDNGGAINNWGTMSITGSSFENNRASGSYGGAVFTRGKGEIENSVFSANQATEGGAVYTYNNAELSVADSSFIGNYVTNNPQGVSNYGGAIYANGKLSVRGTLFDGNHATEAGAVKISRQSKESSFLNSEFKNNKAEIRDGGAIVHSGGCLAIEQTMFSNNQSVTGSGGAILTEAAMNITGNSIFSHNTAALGGGAIYAISGADTTINGATFNNNSSQSGNGGAISATSATPLAVTNASFLRNYAEGGKGGAVYATGDTIMKNVIFEENKAINGGAINSSGNLSIGGNSSFTGNEAATGGAIYMEGDLTLNTEDGNIIFSGNKVTGSNGSGADVYLGKEHVNVVIEGNNNILSMDGGFAGLGSILKTGANTVIFDKNADNEMFEGDFTQTAGATIVYADNFFGGQNTIAQGSILHFADQAQIGSLHLETKGQLDLRRPGPFSANTVTVTDLLSDGSASVILQTDGTTSDLLKITGSATGMITLDVQAIGSNPTKKEIEVVNTENASGDAIFKLADGKVDIGAHEYGLSSGSDANWYLKTEGELNKTAKSVETLPSLHLSIVNAGMNELRKRLGDLRGNNPNSPVGTWTRGYGKHLRVHEKNGARMNMLGMEGGIDTMAELFNGRTYFGIMGGYLSSDDIHVFQTSSPDAKGSNKTPVAGLYATWLPHDSPWFVDLTARHFWVHTSLNNIVSSNGINGYDVKRGFWAFTAETGRQFNFDAPQFLNIKNSLITVESKLELRHVRGDSKYFTTNNGETGFIDATNSFVTKFNIQTSYLPAGLSSDWKLYWELGLYNEWMGRTKIKFADTHLTTSDLSGLGIDTTLGFNASITEDAYCYGAVTLEAGEAYTSYQVNAGLRVSF